VVRLSTQIKTDVVLFGTGKKLGFLSTLTRVNVARSSLHLSKKVKILEATLHQQLTFQDNINSVRSASFYDLRSFRHVRPALTQDIAKTLGSAVICAKLDNTNFMAHLSRILNYSSMFKIHRRELSQAHPHQAPLKIFNVFIECRFNIAFATKFVL
jgi:hypothetical protein